MNVFEGKVALVTGGTRGIGAASARALAKAGADVAVSYASSKDAADAIVAELGSYGVRARAFRADQADPAAAAQLVEDVVDAFGQLDILVNNAGITHWAPVGSEFEDADASERQHAVNYTSVVAAIRAAVPYLPDGGRIISIGSGVGTRVGSAGLADYAATKSALAGFSRGASRDLADKGITVNVLQAGYTNTDSNPQDGPMADTFRSYTALGRYARPEEIAAGVVFLASPDASYVTGTVLNIDGGYGA